MPENKVLRNYVDEHIKLLPIDHFYPDIECLLPASFLRHQQAIKDLEVYEDDIWVLTYPKCGTTWCQEMVWMIVNDLDYKGAEVNLDIRYAFLEISSFMPDPPPNKDEDTKDALPFPDTLKQAETMPRPRFIKCHLPLALLPTQLFEKKAKVFFVLRDPKDAAVSYLHHYRIMIGYNGTAEKFYEAFLEGCVNYGSYWHYLAPLWKLRHEPNVFVTTYEEMKKDLSHVIRRAAVFLGKTLKEEDMPGLLEHLSFSQMKSNDATNYTGFVKTLNDLVGNDKPAGEFMRNGQVGDYKNAMSEELVKKFQQHHTEMKRKLGLADDKDFPY